MKHADLKSRLIPLCAIVLPIALVKITGAFIGPAKSVASSDVEAPRPASLQIVRVPESVDPATGRALQHLEQIQADTFGISPFLVEQAAVTQSLEPITVDDDPVNVRVRLQAVMTSSGTRLALIDGALYRLGDAVEDVGCTLIAIDTVKLTVTLMHDASETEFVVSVLGNDD